MGFEKGNESNLSHGSARRGRHTPEYRCWIDMKSRCLNEDHASFGLYGARGITIYDRWIDSFENFLEDVGKRPSPKYTLDRYPDNDGNYEPDNVRWATHQQQVDNRRNTRKITIQGETLSLTQACIKHGLSRKLVATRLDRGWTSDRAIGPARWNRKVNQRRNP